MRDRKAEERKTECEGWRFDAGDQVKLWEKVGTAAVWHDGIIIERVVESYWGEGRPIKWYEDECYDVLSRGRVQRVHVDSLRVQPRVSTE